MNQLTVELPESLYQELETLARDSGTSLLNYVVHALEQAVVGERLSALGVDLSQFERVPLKQGIQEHEAFLQRKKQWGRRPTDEEMETFLASRERVEPEPELDAERVANLEERLIREWKQWRAATEEDLNTFLDAREPGEPEPDLDPKAAAYLKEQIALARERRRAMAE